MYRKLNGATAALITLVSAQAYAVDSDPSSIFSFSGYGTLGMTHSSEPRADYVVTPFQPKGAGRTEDWAFSTDSRLAGQISAQVNPQWSAVVQVVVEQQWDNSYTPSLEWANVQYAPTQNFSIRVGRIALPTLLMSNYRKVGYALPWVRMPATLYSTLPVSNSDGVDASYSMHFGELKNTLSVLAGKKTLKLATGPLAGTKAEMHDLIGVVDAINYGAATLQLTHLQSNATDVRSVNSQRLKTNGIGANYDPGDWFVMGEFIKTEFALFGKVTNWYVGAGYRYNDFTPYVSVSDRRLLTNTPNSVKPPQKSVAVGIRWDVMKNADIKLQYDRNSLSDKSRGMLINPLPDYVPGRNYHLVSATVDFVF